MDSQQVETADKILEGPYAGEAWGIIDIKDVLHMTCNQTGCWPKVADVNK